MNKIFAAAVILAAVSSASAGPRFWEAGLRFGTRSATVSNLVPLGNPGTDLKVDPQTGTDLFFRMNFDNKFSNMSLCMKNFQSYTKYLDEKYLSLPRADIEGAPGATFYYPFNMLWTLKGAAGVEVGKNLYLLGGMIYRFWELEFGVVADSTDKEFSLGDFLFAAGPGAGIGKTFMDNSLRLGGMWYHSWGWYSTVNEIDLFAEYDLNSHVVLRAGYTILDANGLAVDLEQNEAALEDDVALQAAEALITHISFAVQFCWGEASE